MHANDLSSRDIPRCERSPRVASRPRTVACVLAIALVGACSGGEQAAADPQRAAVHAHVVASPPCPAGYNLEGEACVDLDECAQVATPCVTPLATCANLPGAYDCACPPGYVGGGAAACTPRVVAGGLGTCFMPPGQGLWCIGARNVPVGSSGPSDFVPWKIDGLDDAVAVSVDPSGHACALRQGGRVSCWGDNSSGQLGDGTTEFREQPVPVSGLSDVVSLSVGQLGTCAVVRGGALFCWGAAVYSALRADGRTAPSVPTRIPLDDVVHVAVGMHSCAVRRSGSVVCWGYNTHGQMGLGTRSGSVGLTLVPGLENAVMIALGRFHTVALTSTGSVAWWGYDRVSAASEGAEREGELRGVTAIPGIENAIGLGASEHLTCVLERGAGVFCEGPSTPEWLRWRRGRPPVNVRGTEGAVAMTCGMAHCVIIDASGRLAGWGSNHRDQIDLSGPREVRTITPDFRWEFFAIRPASPSMGGVTR